MKRIVLLTITVALIWSGWAWAREEEMLNHSADVHLQEMQDASCDPSTCPSSGG